MAGARQVSDDAQHADAYNACNCCEGACKSESAQCKEVAIPNQRERAQQQKETSPADDSQAQEVMQMARQRRLGPALQLLEQKPQLWGTRDADGHSLLHWGALLGNADFVRCAIVMGCPVDAQANNGQTPLMWAVLKGHLPVTRILLDAKADMCTKDSMGATALIIAAQNKSYECMLLLLRRGGDKLMADRDNNGCTVAHWAAFKGDIQSLRLLDYFDIDLQALDSARMTPLHRATRGNKHEVAQFLVEKGSDPTQQNGQGSSCIDFASEQKDQKMQGILKKAKPTGAAEDLESGEPAPAEAAQGKKSKKGFMDTLTTDKHTQKAFPVFWLVCVSLSVFEYLTVIRPTGLEVAPWCSLMFELGVPLSLLIFTWVAFADPGKLPSQPKGRSGMEELMKGLDVDVSEDSLPDVSRLCTTTWVLKGLRTKYCTQTGACVEEFDHYCVWLNTAIGRGNHRQFICLAITEWATQIIFLCVCWNVGRALVETGSTGSWLIGVILGYPFFTLLVLLHVLTVPWVTVLVKQHVGMIGANLTTNEMMNYQRYDHFWTTVDGQRKFKNPFSKGGYWQNHRDFWWARGRGQPKACASNRPKASASSCRAGGCSRC